MNTVCDYFVSSQSQLCVCFQTTGNIRIRQTGSTLHVSRQKVQHYLSLKREGGWWRMFWGGLSFKRCTDTLKCMSHHLPKQTHHAQKEKCIGANQLIRVRSSELSHKPTVPFILLQICIGVCNSCVPRTLQISGPLLSCELVIGYQVGIPHCFVYPAL